MKKSRKDSKGRLLWEGEDERSDGRHRFRKTVNGKQTEITGNTLSELRDKEKRFLRDLEDGIDVAAARKTLNEQFDEYMETNCNLANSTRMNYLDLWENNLRNHALGKKSISDIKKTDILRFYKSLVDRGLKYSTLKIFQAMIAPALQLAVDDDAIRKNPAIGCLKGFENDADEKESLTIEQQNLLEDFLKNSKHYTVYYPMVVFALQTGLRCGELIGLTWNDVDMENQTVDVNHQLLYKKKDGGYRLYADEPKTDAGIRKFPMTDMAVQALRQQREQQLARGWQTTREIDGFLDFVFSTKNKTPMMPSAVNNVLKNIVNAINRTSPDAEFPHISAHILRHTACTRMAEAEMDIKVVQYIMGHHDISITMNVYNHVSEARKQLEIAKLDKSRTVH